MKKAGLILIIILLTLTIVRFLTPNAFCEESTVIENSLGKFKIGQNADSLRYFLIPTPIEEGGFHIIYNPGEKTYLRTSLTYRGPKKWNIKTLRVSYKDEFFDKVRLNDHLMITGISMLNLETAKGIKLGSKTGEVEKLYGAPRYRKSSGALTEWIYTEENGSKREFCSFVFKDGKVVAVNIGEM